ncbi:MAG: homoserine O-succinyltransferase [Oscillospiraceae bacterium]|jgi:homoserine O-succinyltransferase|nr:homoserine O-succinyltransferase [Oscillospiraceae bacterium]
MSVIIRNNLPSADVLRDENIFVMRESNAKSQDIRPLKILVLNLMPTKSVTESQFLRKLSNSPLQAEIEFIHMVSHTSRNTDPGHMEQYYTTFGAVRHRKFDGLIITGAPVETLRFEDVDYWGELCELMRWSETNVFSTLHICWGAQAGLYFHYGVNKHSLPQKLSGVFAHELVNPKSPLFFGCDDRIMMPHSRFTEVRESEIRRVEALQVMAISDEAGVAIVKSSDNRRFFIFGHPEYDSDTLAKEYFRDQAAGLGTAVPRHYFPGDDPSNPPTVNWKANASLIYSNWLNYYVYQSTSFDIENIPARSNVND